MSYQPGACVDVDTPALRQAWWARNADPPRMLLEDDRLRAEAEQATAECPHFHRASGEMPCPTCGEPYWRHPRHWPFIWLNVLCDGLAVKL